MLGEPVVPGPAGAADDAAGQAAAYTALSLRQGRDGHYAEAVTTARHAVTLWRGVVASAPEHTVGLAEALHFLGAWLGEMGRMESAAAAAHEAVALLRGRAAHPSQREIRTLAMALTVLGTHLMKLGRRAEGITAAQDAVRTARPLLPSDPSRNTLACDPETYVVAATAFSNLGLHLRGEGRHLEALSSEREANEIWRRLAATDPFYEPDLAASLSNLGIQLAESGNPAEGLTAEEEAVLIRRRLVESSPGTHESDLARSLSNLAVRQTENDRWHDAEAASREAVEMYRRLARMAPAVHNIGLARTLSHRATIVGHLGGAEQALAPMDEAAGLYGRLARSNPEAYDEDLVAVLAAKGRYLTLAGHVQEAVDAALAEAEVRRRLRKRLPHHSLDLATTLQRLADLHDGLGETERSVTAHAEAVEVLTEFHEDFPDEGAPHLAAALILASEQLGGMENHERALALGAQGIEIMGDLVAGGEESWRVDLGNALANRGLWLSLSGHLDEATEAIDAALELYDTQPVGGAGLPRAWLARLLRMKGRVLSRLRRYEEALAVHDELVGLLEDLAATEPANYTGELAEVLSVTGSMACAIGSTRHGIAYFEQALRTFDILSDTGSISRIAVLLELSQALEHSDDLEQALARVELAESLCRCLPGSPEPRHDLLPNLLRQRSAVLARMGRFRDAVAALREAVSALELRARESHEEEGFEQWAAALGQFAALLSQADDLDGALQAARQQVEVLAGAQVSASGPQARDRLLGARDRLHDLLVRAAMRLARDGQMAASLWEEAVSVKEAVVASLRDAAGADAPRYEPYLPMALRDLGIGLMVLGRLPACREVLEEGILLARRLWTDEAEQHWLGYLLDLLGECLIMSGDTEPASVITEESLMVWTRLRTAEHPAATDSRLAAATARRERLSGAT